MIEEIFKPIPNYEEYQVSNLGNIKGVSVDLLKPRDTGKGYLTVALYKNKIAAQFKVHRLVMLAFVGESKLFVDHINRCPSDNRLENLRYCTNRQNITFCYENKKTSSKYTGVCFDKSKNKWVAYIRHDAKRIYLGRYNCETTAMVAYQRKLKEFNISN